MKINTLLAVAAAVGPASASAAGTGADKMERVMQLKTEQWEAARSKGLFGGSTLYRKITRKQACINGFAKHGDTSYACNNVNLHGFLSHEDLGSKTKAGNDVWGWTSKGGREFGIVGQTDGVGFVEITKNGNVEYLGRLDTQTTATSWRDIKVIGDHAYIGAESHDHGLQIFDLRKLLDIKPWWNPFFWKPKNFDKNRDLTALYTGFGASHNLVAHEETNMIYAVGGRSGANARNTTCAGGMFMVDVSDPANPTSPGCVGQDGYVHDAQCVIYTGPSEQYRGREVCFNYNEDHLTVMDLTDKSAPVVVSRTPYEGVAYAHQGWLVDETMTFLLLDDELDEQDGTAPGGQGHTTTYIFNVTNLEAPINTGYYHSPAKSIDHNQYVSLPCPPPSFSQFTNQQPNRSSRALRTRPTTARVFASWTFLVSRPTRPAATSRRSASLTATRRTTRSTAWLSSWAPGLSSRNSSLDTSSSTRLSVASSP
jgi:choice-of-anchor B domain-containing protein